MEESGTVVPHPTVPDFLLNIQDAEYVAELESKGKAIYQSNEDMKAFAEVCAHPLFVDFAAKFTNSWDECKNTIMFLKTCDYIRASYKKVTGNDISGYCLVAILSNIINNPDSRARMARSMLRFMEETDMEGAEQQFDSSMLQALGIQQVDSALLENRSE